MVMEFSDLRYTGPQSFEAGSSSLLQSNLLLGINATQNTPWTQAGWDNDGIGQAAVYYGNARMANAVPEPGTTTLLLAGLAGVAGAAAARRRRDTLGVQTPRTDTTPTPEAATAE